MCPMSMSLFNHNVSNVNHGDLFFPSTVRAARRTLKRVVLALTLGERKRGKTWAFLFCVCVFLVRWWNRPRVEPSFFLFGVPQTKQNAQMSNNAAHRFRVLADVRGWSRQSHQTQNNKKEEQKKYPRRGPHVVSFFLCSLPAGLEEKNSESKFRSWDLWVMSPTR